VKVKSIILGAALVLASSLPAAAQGTLGVGVSFLHEEGFTATGVAVNYAGDLKQMDKATLSWVGDVSFHKGDGTTASMYQGGVRYTAAANDKVNVFGQFMLGAWHCCEFTDFVLTPGGGVTVVLNPKWNFLAQVDFPLVQDEFDNFTETRLTFGVSTNLGK
jgi:hypothetical protein